MDGSCQDRGSEEGKKAEPAWPAGAHRGRDCSFWRQEWGGGGLGKTEGTCAYCKHIHTHTLRFSPPTKPSLHQPCNLSFTPRLCLRPPALAAQSPDTRHSSGRCEKEVVWGSGAKRSRNHDLPGQAKLLTASLLFSLTSWVSLREVQMQTVQRANQLHMPLH